jgi:hypothetical protein
VTHPQDLTPLQAAAHELHEVYVAYVEAGFHPDQAMQLVGVIVTASLNQPPVDGA